MQDIYFLNFDFTVREDGETNPLISIPAPTRRDFGWPLEVDFNGVVGAYGFQFPLFDDGYALMPSADATGRIRVKFNDVVSAFTARVSHSDPTASITFKFFGEGKKNLIHEQTLTFSSQIVDAGYNAQFENLIKRVVIIPSDPGLEWGITQFTLQAERPLEETWDYQRKNPLIGDLMWKEDEIHFSFIEADSDLSGYTSAAFDGGGRIKKTAAALTAEQRQIFAEALFEFAKVSDLHFLNEPDDSERPGHMRIGRADLSDGNAGPPNLSAFAPGLRSYNSDIFLSDRAPDAPNTARENLIKVQFMQGIATAVGLQSADEVVRVGNSFSNPQSGFPVDLGRGDHSVLGQETGYVRGEAIDTLSIADIRALQTLYGANTTHFRGDTTYTYRPDQGVIFETIWDAGGDDTIDVSAYRQGITFNLQPGAMNLLRPAQLAELQLPGGNRIDAAYNVGMTETYRNVPSLIENLIGTSKDDTFTGNDARNVLKGEDGEDELIGLDGNDVLRGGRGDDVLRGGKGNDKLIGGGGDDTLFGGSDSFPGHNTLIGNAGADTFRLIGDKNVLVYKDVDDSSRGAIDRVYGFSLSTVDLSDIFRGSGEFIGRDSFSGAPEVRMRKIGNGSDQARDDYALLADVDGDKDADLVIRFFDMFSWRIDVDF